LFGFSLFGEIQSINISNNHIHEVKPIEASIQEPNYLNQLKMKSHGMT